MSERKMIYLDDAIDAVAEGLKRTFVEYRDVAEKMLNKLPSAQPTDAEVQKMQDLEQAEIQKAYELGKLDVMEEMPHWIPCSERLPEEDTEVLISYCYKEGEGDTDHVNIDITSYGTTCFGGREIHTLKEWRQPFDYFHANYEVIAWMPLPTPYREE